MRAHPRRCNDAPVPPVTQLLVVLLVVRPGALAIIPPALAVLFWLWLAVAVIIYITRLVRRISRRGSGSGTSAPDAGAGPGSARFGARGRLELRAHRCRGPRRRRRRRSRGGSSRGHGARGTDRRLGIHAPADVGGEPRPSPVWPSRAGPARRAARASSPPPAESGGAGAAGGPRRDAPRPTVVEAIRGIVMPCNLAPVVDGSVSIPNPFRVAFLTADADAVTVGAAIGDELQRLGFTLTTPAATELLARKPGVELRVMLYPTASAARRGLDLIFPAAPANAVGVEFTT